MDEGEKGAGAGAESSMTMGNREAPHQGLFLMITYLPLMDLLSMRAVCRSLRDAVNHDVLPWLQLTVTAPLSRRLSDSVLVELCDKARGRLTSLALINCNRITDRALQIVSENNPFIRKLHVPGCTSLTLDGIVRAVKTLTDRSDCLTSLKINGIYNIDRHHLEVLNTFLQQTNSPHRKQPSLQLHQRFKKLSSLDKDDPIDVSLCPWCDEVRMVFDCSRKNCTRRKRLKECRGCGICIPRCVECGGCFDPDEDEEEEEVACTHMVCSTCWLLLPKCSFCNKPYCNLNDCRYSRIPNSSGFACDTCCARFVTVTSPDSTA